MNLLKYLKETRAELTRVVFPSVRQTVSYTIIVIFLSIFVAFLLGGADFIFREGLTKLLSL